MSFARRTLLLTPGHQAPRLVKAVLGALTVCNAVPRLAATPPGIDWLGPELGAHNEEIYGGRLGLSAEELAGLRARGIV